MENYLITTLIENSKWNRLQQLLLDKNLMCMLLCIADTHWCAHALSLAVTATTVMNMELLTIPIKLERTLKEKTSKKRLKLNNWSKKTQIEFQTVCGSYSILVLVLLFLLVSLLKFVIKMPAPEDVGYRISGANTNRLSVLPTLILIKASILWLLRL